MLLDPCVLTHDCCCGMHVGRHVVPIILLHVVLQLLMVKLLLVMLVLTGSRMTCKKIDKCEMIVVMETINLEKTSQFRIHTKHQNNQLLAFGRN